MEWTKVSFDSLPPEDTPVMVTARQYDLPNSDDEYRKVVHGRIAFCREDMSWRHFDGYMKLPYYVVVTHWAPMPHPAEDN